jgi:penicillin-binding protein 1A
MRAGPNTKDVILEAYKPGTAPADNYAVVGYGNGDNSRVPPPDGRTWNVSPEAGRAIRSGTGGLY